MAKKNKLDVELHCRVEEESFSRAMLCCRICTGGTFIYLAIGSLLYWREFLINTAICGLPWPIYTACILAGGTLLIGLLLLLGCYTRWCARGAVLWAAGYCAVFFAGDYNAVCGALYLSFLASLSVLMWLGPGKLSIDFKRSQRKAFQSLRGKL